MLFGINLTAADKRLKHEIFELERDFIGKSVHDIKITTMQITFYRRNHPQQPYPFRDGFVQICTSGLLFILFVQLFYI